jgi:hypothetical protein
MKLLFENWRKFILNEKLSLKPGPNGWDLYGELVTRAYEKAPKFDPSAVSSFEAMEPFTNKMFKRIQSKVKIQFVDDNPYSDDEHMRQEVKKSGILKIWKGGTEHPVFDRELNLKLRAVHDWMAHIQPSGFSGAGFDQKGEIQAYNAHIKTVPPKAVPALFTEVVGQASHFLNRGYFPEQKIAFLEGFDYFNIGKVDPKITGYVLDPIRKELVKVEDMEEPIEESERGSMGLSNTNIHSRYINGSKVSDSKLKKYHDANEEEQTKVNKDTASFSKVK